MTVVRRNKILLVKKKYKDAFQEIKDWGWLVVKYQNRVIMGPVEKSPNDWR